MSSVAVIQLTDRHTEVVGGMITLFGKLFKYIDIYYKSYDSDFCNYYKDILKSPDYTIRLHKNPKKIGKHDLYVFMTGLEYFDFEEDIIPPERTLLLSHHVDEYKEDLKYLKDIAGVFAISPVYKKYKKVPYFLTYSNIVNKIEKKSGEKDQSIFVWIYKSLQQRFRRVDQVDGLSLRRRYRYVQVSRC